MTHSRRTPPIVATTTTVYLAGIVEYTTGNTVVSSYAGMAVRTTTGNPSSTNKGTLSYLHDDHLGSVSATSNGTADTTRSLGAVTSSQSYDPWGAVRSSVGNSGTEFNYTGQRKDAGTGLLFYNARYYDPALARFVQADTIAPNYADPQTRNRYSYVLNNPLKYIDPTGHCAQGDGDDPQQCQKQVGRLAEYGIVIDNMADWSLQHLSLIFQSLMDWSAATCREGSCWNATDFKRAFDDVVFKRDRNNSSCCAFENNGTVTFYEGAFTNLNDFQFKQVTVHELAHRWDEVVNRRSRGVPYPLTNGLVATTGGFSFILCFTAWCYKQGDVANRPSDYSGHSPYEDFAESVTHTIYGSTLNNGPGNPSYKGSARDIYIKRLLKNW